MRACAPSPRDVGCSAPQVANFPDDPAFFVPKCLEAKVAAGDLGRKTGRGFYMWDGDKPFGVVE